ncbi:hypothetical protein SM139_4150, partial [Stenotrophomonas maltophilia]
RPARSSRWKAPDWPGWACARSAGCRRCPARCCRWALRSPSWPVAITGMRTCAS